MTSRNNCERVECVVIGAGVVGLAIAAAIARSGQDVIVLEAQDRIGAGVSSRNSEVIHAGIYYPKDTLKASLCVQGKNMLYQYIKDRNIGHKKCGKLIVATQEKQIEQLLQINEKAKANGVDDLTFISKEEAQDIESDLQCHAALHSPSTGIIDTHDFMISLQGDIENNAGSIVFLTLVIGGAINDDGIELKIRSQNDVMTLKAQTVINAAGLGATVIAQAITGFPKDKIPELKYAKGNYFSLIGKHNFKHLIYPVPEEAGLGVHLTLDLDGKARFGPDVEWVDKLDYKVNQTRAKNFSDAIRAYWPDIKDSALVPDYSGIRPKIYWGDKPHTDFIIQGKDEHGIGGLINLFGIESPGLTSSLAIAKYVMKQISAH
ncbi:MAG: NAD(P)/FAD-dependent oxidoreductase [Alphaproteobacteria bacterium]